MKQELQLREDEAFEHRVPLAAAAFNVLRAIRPFTDAILAAQDAGRARTDIAAGDLAVIVLAAWHGVLLRAKVERRGDAPAMFARTLPLLLSTQ